MYTSNITRVAVQYVYLPGFSGIKDSNAEMCLKQMYWAVGDQSWQKSKSRQVTTPHRCKQLTSRQAGSSWCQNPDWQPLYTTRNSPEQAEIRFQVDSHSTQVTAAHSDRNRLSSKSISRWPEILEITGIRKSSWANRKTKLTTNWKKKKKKKKLATKKTSWDVELGKTKWENEKQLWACARRTCWN